MKRGAPLDGGAGGGGSLKLQGVPLGLGSELGEG